jgi:hypothetical protein
MTDWKEHSRCGFACASLSLEPGFGSAVPALVSVACGVVGDRLVGSGLHDPAYELRHQPSGRTRILRRSRLRLTRTTSRRR